MSDLFIRNLWKLGVHSAMNIKEAYRLCPDRIYMHPNFEKYRRVSDHLHQIWISYLSLDEGYLDLTASLVFLPTQEERIIQAREIKRRTKAVSLEHRLKRFGF